MRRFRVIFVDDEDVSRMRFQQLAENAASREWELVGICSDGGSALSMITEKQADIVVSDINMPFMDGIELLRRIRSEHPAVRVILLTGYEFFEYARKAMELRAIDFLLKPVSSERLEEAMERAIYDIELERARSEELGRSRELAQGSFLNRLAAGRFAIDRVLAEAEAVELPTKGRFLFLQVLCDEKRGAELISDVDERDLLGEIEYEIRSFCEEGIGGRSIRPLFSRNRESGLQTLLFFLSDWEDETDGAVESGAAEIGRRILAVHKGEERFDITIGVGKRENKLTEIPESVQSVRRALANRHILGLNRLIYDSNFLADRSESESMVLPTDRLLSDIRTGETKKVEEDIAAIYDRIRFREYLSLESARMVTTELAITAFKGDIASSDGESVSYLYYLNHIQQLNTLDEMEEDITALARSISEKRRQRSNGKQQLAEQALDYLKEHYREADLSLNTVAEVLHISVPYLAVLFKQETGQNFSAHLLRIRMEKAQELLRSTQMSASEIAEELGYSSSQYFSVCFKKYVGMTPGAFRES